MSKEMVSHFYENVYGKGPLKPEGELRERIEELEKQELGFIQSLRELEAENAELREMVIRMYQHCTIEKAEMTEAESDEWMTLAAALEADDEH